jgi:leader peptidase (prepilin peptidase) / N-methyltransferase
VSVFVGVGCALLGAVLGPVLAGLTVRVPADEPMVSAGGWLGRPASRARRIVVTLLAAAVLGAIGAGIGADAALPAYLWLGMVGVTLGVIDVDCHRLPDRLTLPSYPIALALLGAASLAHHDLATFGRALLAAAVVFAVFFLMAFISPRSLGLGDVKLVGLLGLYLGWLGWGVLLLGLVAGFAVGAVVAIVLLIGRRVGWRSDVAFGPSLLAGALLAVVAGQRLVDAYLTAAGLPPTT